MVKQTIANESRTRNTLNVHLAQLYLQRIVATQT